jgi:TonB family protein
MLETYLISVAMKSTILLAAGLVFLRCLRGRSAAVRHLVGMTALGSAAVVPLLALWSPQWSHLITVPATLGAGPGTNTGATDVSNWPIALVGVWALGTLLMAIRAAGGWLVLRSIRAKSSHFQNGSAAEVRIGDVSTPLACGVLRPIILLPETAQDWDERRLRAVLLHEAAHVNRADCLTKYVAQASRALLWWNPLAWMLATRLNHEQELACDDAVLAAGVPADDYATVLMDLMRECPRPLVFGCAMTGGTGLRERFAHLFEWRPGTAHIGRRSAIAIPLLLLFMTTVSFAEKIYKIGPGIVPPKILEKREPQYTEEAKTAKLEGTVGLTLVVGVDQVAHDIKVTRSLDPGLDANAIWAIRAWRFQPATKNGKPVPVRAQIEVNYRLK